MKMRTNNKYLQGANPLYLQTALFAAIPDSLRRLVQAAYVSHGGAEFMKLSDWRDLELELNRGFKMKTDNLTDKRTRLMASLIAVPACQSHDDDTDWFPAVDLDETGQEYVFEVDLPGLKPADIQLEVDSAGISISGKRLPVHHGVKRLRTERPSGAFVRQLPLPPDTTGEVLGSFCDGVLELRIPKANDHTKSN